MRWIKSRINEENRKLYGKARLQDILLNQEVSILLKFEQQWVTVRVPEAMLGTLPNICNEDFL